MLLKTVELAELQICNVNACKALVGNFFCNIYTHDDGKPNTYMLHDDFKSIRSKKVANINFRKLCLCTKIKRIRMLFGRLHNITFT